MLFDYYDCCNDNGVLIHKYCSHIPMNLDPINKFYVNMLIDLRLDKKLISALPPGNSHRTLRFCGGGVALAVLIAKKNGQQN